MRRATRLWTFALILLLASVSAQALTNTHFSDLDGDGDLDMFLETLIENRAGPTFVSLNQIDDIGNVSNVTQGYFVDVNGDGDEDLYIVRASLHNRLYLNDGDKTFTNVTNTSALGRNLTGDPSAATAAAFADFDNDGDIDAFVEEQFFATVGSFGDTNGTNSSNIDELPALDHAVPHDMNLDGLIDLVGVQENGSIVVFLSIGDTNGDGVCEFYDGTRTMNLQDISDVNVAAASDINFGLAVNFSVGFFPFLNETAPFIADNFVDLYLGKSTSNQLLMQRFAQPADPLRIINQSSFYLPQFTDESAGSGVADTENTTATIIADFDGDGTRDIFIGNDEPTSSIYLRNGTSWDVTFANNSVNLSINNTKTAQAADLNGDGDLDLAGIDASYIELLEGVPILIDYDFTIVDEFGNPDSTGSVTSNLGDPVANGGEVLYTQSEQTSDDKVIGAITSGDGGDSTPTDDAVDATIGATGENQGICISTAGSVASTSQNIMQATGPEDTGGTTGPGGGSNSGSGASSVCTCNPPSTGCEEYCAQTSDTPPSEPINVPIPEPEQEQPTKVTKEEPTPVEEQLNLEVNYVLPDWLYNKPGPYSLTTGFNWRPLTNPQYFTWSVPFLGKSISEGASEGERDFSVSVNWNFDREQTQTPPNLPPRSQITGLVTGAQAADGLVDPDVSQGDSEDSSADTGADGFTDADASGGESIPGIGGSGRSTAGAGGGEQDGETELTGTSDTPDIDNTPEAPGSNEPVVHANLNAGPYALKYTPRGPQDYTIAFPVNSKTGLTAHYGEVSLDLSRHKIEETVNSQWAEGDFVIRNKDLSQEYYATIDDYYEDENTSIIDQEAEEFVNIRLDEVNNVLEALENTEIGDNVDREEAYEIADVFSGVKEVFKLKFNEYGKAEDVGKKVQADAPYLSQYVKDLINQLIRQKIRVAIAEKAAKEAIFKLNAAFPALNVRQDPTIPGAFNIEVDKYNSRTGETYKATALVFFNTVDFIIADKQGGHEEKRYIANAYALTPADNMLSIRNILNNIDSGKLKSTSSQQEDAFKELPPDKFTFFTIGDYFAALELDVKEAYYIPSDVEEGSDWRKANWQLWNIQYNISDLVATLDFDDSGTTDAAFYISNINFVIVDQNGDIIENDEAVNFLDGNVDVSEENNYELSLANKPSAYLDGGSIVSAKTFNFYSQNKFAEGNIKIGNPKVNIWAQKGDIDDYKNKEQETKDWLRKYIEFRSLLNQGKFDDARELAQELTESHANMPGVINAFISVLEAVYEASPNKGIFWDTTLPWDILGLPSGYTIMPTALTVTVVDHTSATSNIVLEERGQEDVMIGIDEDRDGQVDYIYALNSEVFIANEDTYDDPKNVYEDVDISYGEPRVINLELTLSGDPGPVVFDEDGNPLVGEEFDNGRKYTFELKDGEIQSIEAVEGFERYKIINRQPAGGFYDGEGAEEITIEGPDGKWTILVPREETDDPDAILRRLYEEMETKTAPSKKYAIVDMIEIDEGWMITIRDAYGREWTIPVPGYEWQDYVGGDSEAILDRLKQRMLEEDILFEPGYLVDESDQPYYDTRQIGDGSSYENDELYNPNELEEYDDFIDQTGDDEITAPIDGEDELSENGGGITRTPVSGVSMSTPPGYTFVGVNKVVTDKVVTDGGQSGYEYVFRHERSGREITATADNPDQHLSEINADYSTASLNDGDACRVVPLKEGEQPRPGGIQEVRCACWMTGAGAQANTIYTSTLMQPDETITEVCAAACPLGSKSACVNEAQS